MHTSPRPVHTLYALSTLFTQTQVWEVIRTVVAPPSIVVKCGEVVLRVVVCGGVLVVSCVVLLCCSCRVVCCVVLVVCLCVCDLFLFDMTAGEVKGEPARSG